MPTQNRVVAILLKYSLDSAEIFHARIIKTSPHHYGSAAVFNCRSYAVWVHFFRKRATDILSSFLTKNLELRFIGPQDLFPVFDVLVFVIFGPLKSLRSIATPEERFSSGNSAPKAGFVQTILDSSYRYLMFMTFIESRLDF